MFLSDVSVSIDGDESDVMSSSNVDYGLLAYYASVILNYDDDYLCHNSLNRILKNIIEQYHLYTEDSIEQFLVEKCS